MSKCFENFVSQTLGFLASFFCCGIKDIDDANDDYDGNLNTEHHGRYGKRR